MTEINYKKVWSDKASKELRGKTIKEARYLTQKEVDKLGWYNSTLAIFFTDGSYIFPSADDEGNEAGALFTNIKGLETIPTI